MSVVFIFMLKNVGAYFIFKDKAYLGFSFILFLLNTMIFVNRILSNMVPTDSVLLDAGDIFNIILMSGAVVYFSNYFTKIRTINPFTVFYFYFELLAGIVLIGILFIAGDIVLLSSLAHLIVLVYSVILIVIIIYEFVNVKKVVGRFYTVRIITFLIMQITFTIMTFMKAAIVSVHISLYAGTFLMIALIEVELLFRARVKNTGKNIGLNLDKFDERERIIVELLIQGDEYKEIAYRTGKTYNTIKKYVHNIYKKYNVKNKAELLNKIIHGDDLE